MTETFDSVSFLDNLTSLPGVYKMLDAQGQVLYVGKARSLKKRVSQYFRAADQLDPKTRTMMVHMRRVEVTATHTEGEALLLEGNLIKSLAPRYNILLRDDKSYPYIYLSSHQDYPRLSLHRGARKGRGRYFGPFPSAGAVRASLNLLQKLFQVRQCEDSFFGNRSRPCLQHQIKRCTAPCVGAVSPADYADDIRHAVMFLEGRSKEVVNNLVRRMEAAARELEFEQAARYRDQITKMNSIQERQYVAGGTGNLDVIAAARQAGQACIQVLYVRDGRQLDTRQFFPAQAEGTDEATLLRAFISQYYLVGARASAVPAELLLSAQVEDTEALAHLLTEQAGHKVSIRPKVRGERSRWVSMAKENARLGLAQRLSASRQQAGLVEALRDALDLDAPPQRMECFDISHTSGEATVASCVVFGVNGPLKSDYRRFNIKDIQPGDDYAAMQQALQRRYTRIKKEDGSLPDILFIDGGRGQLSTALEVLDELQMVGVMLVGVAKGEGRKPGLESLFLPGRSTPIILPADSPALHLVQQIRDEAHRFAIAAHRNRRARKRSTSPLEDLPGIGPRRRQRLLQQFGGLRGLAKAGVEDLLRVEGISRQLAQTVYDVFHDN